MSPKISKVRELRKIFFVAEANKMLCEGWILLYVACVGRHRDIVFVLGREGAS
jgi:hypothetical protein